MEMSRDAWNTRAKAEPVAVVMPGRKPEDAFDESQSPKDYFETCGWNAYDDEYKRLNL